MLYSTLTMLTMLLTINEAMAKSINEELQSTELLKAVPYLISMKKAVRMLGVLKTTKANPTSLSSRNPPFFSFLERFLEVTAERQNRKTLRP